MAVVPEPTEAPRVDRIAGGRPASRLLLVQASVTWLVLVLLVAAAGPLVQPSDYAATDLFNVRQPPVFLGGDWRHILGTDDLGRDVLSRVIYGTRISVVIALAGTIIGAVLGTFLGLLAAHWRGWVDDIIMTLVDAQAALPFLIFALAVLAFFAGSFWVLVIVVGIDGWERYARLSRGMALSSGEDSYIDAVRSLGIPTWRLYAVHLLPNIVPALVIQFTVNLPGTVLLETSLSFLGLGVQPPMTSLGQMIGYGRDYLLLAPWIAVAPGIVVFLLTLSVSILGDWLRDQLDPSLR